MAYSSVDQVLIAYNPIRTMLGTGTTDIATLDIASFYIPNADSYIDAYLARRYTVPLDPTPLVTMLSADIAVYKLMQDRAPRIPDFLEKRWVAANSILAALINGDMILTGSNTIVASAGDSFAWSNVQSYPNGPVFRPYEENSFYTSSCGLPWTDRIG